MNFSMSGLTGSLPNSWAQPSAFPALQTMNFSVTSLTGTLPISWAESSAFPNLTALYLQQRNITGHSVCLCFGKCTRFMLSTSYTVHLTETLCLVPCQAACIVTITLVFIKCRHMALASSWTAVVTQCCDFVTCLQAISQLHGLVLKLLPFLRHSICMAHN